MKLIIDIDKETYKKVTLNNPSFGDDFPLYYAIKNGTPIPDNATYGDVLDKMLVYVKHMKYSGLRRNLCLELIEKFIDELKAEQEQEPKQGHWIPTPYELDYETDAKCSLCDAWIVDAMSYNYCPNCGAKMIKEVKE